MTPFQVVWKTIRFYRASSLLVVLSIAIATAVITGALLVGDSVRGSLKHLALDRLGYIEHVALFPRFVSASITQRYAESPACAENFDSPIGLILFPNGTAETPAGNRSGSVTVLGIDQDFQSLQPATGSALPDISRGQVALNETLAAELNVTVGDRLTVRLPKDQAVSADSPLGRSDGRVEGLPNLEVVAVLPNKGLGRFDLRASQLPPKNLFVALADVQFVLERDEQINAVFFPQKLRDRTSAVAADSQLDTSKELANSIAEQTRFDLADYGLTLERIRQTFPEEDSQVDSEEETEDQTEDTAEGPKVVFDYYHLASDDLLLVDDVVAQLSDNLANEQSRPQPVLAYLANKIEPSSSKPEVEPVVYSIVAALDFEQIYPDVLDTPLAVNETVITDWLARELQVSEGEYLTIRYFEPETTHGVEQEKSSFLKVRAIVPLTEPSRPFRRNRPAQYDQLPTVFNDPNLTPSVPGITDQDSISNWDLPFPLEYKVNKRDDTYWNNHRLTPKLFVSREFGDAFFGSRFGNTSSLRWNPELFSKENSSKSENPSPLKNTDAEIAEQRVLDAVRGLEAKLGLTPVAVRAMQLEAASGTTPFDYLFLSLSFFVIFGALMLIALLFRLSIEQRQPQLGTLLSLGWRTRQVARILLAEGLLLAAIGAAIGTGFGILYGQLILFMLKNWWVGAVTVPFLDFYASPTSLVIGFIASLFVCWLAIFVSTRIFWRAGALRLLRSDADQLATQHSGRIGIWFVLGCITLLSSIGVASVGFYQSGQARSGAFLGAGMMVLVGLLLLTLSKINSRQNSSNTMRFSITQLASRTLRRRPMRSLLTIGLMAVATFLVLSLTLFQNSPQKNAVSGFRLQATASVALSEDLNDSAYQESILGESSDLDGVTVRALRVKPGDDASCNNLYQTTRPKILGVTDDFVQDQLPDQPATFPFASAESHETGSAWNLLAEREADGSQERPIPCILDMNTAMWSLHKGAAVGEVFAIDFEDDTVHFQTVGLLENTLLQGAVIVSEMHLLDRFPEVEGYAYFLIRVPDGRSLDEITQTLESGWGDEGLDVESTSEVMRQLLAVQNTYLSAFQLLGAIGVMFGTFGIVLVQLRSIWERRGELALLSAIGFRGKRLRQVLLLEALWLMAAGILIGALSAGAAAVPAVMSDNSVQQFAFPLALVTMVLIVGLVASLLATRSVEKLPVLQALRGK